MTLRRRAFALSLAMGAAAALSEATRPRPSGVRPQPLDAVVPKRLGTWRLDPRVELLVRAPRDNGKLYGIYDEVLERVYVNDALEHVMLSIAYGSEQSPGLQAHRPEVCFPSGGFKIDGLHAAELALPQRVPVKRLHAYMPGRSEPITYWMTLGDAVVNDPGAFRWRQLGFGLRGRVLDGLLVRLSSIDRDASRAYGVHARFAAELVAALPTAQRERLIGRAAA
jgi:EpsI family protein